MGAGQAGPRAVSFHPAASKELSKLDPQDRKRVASTIDSLATDGPSAQTHSLTGQLKGWSSTKASRGHRVIHRDHDDGTLHIGYVGLHEYDRAITRLTSTTFFRHAYLVDKHAAAVDNSGGVMVALVPPREIAEQLAMKDGQPADDLH
ncbi:type II toxin-antitoxin system RelE/ParE family toxin, partial [Streptomyces sp. NPDC056670]|uniref:type II toxin-antitoxin system RelE family toxin n=1 Tax=Streptomyces sp. NPDC056670 TaxID=3345904 RepID=UPI0036C1506B